MRKFYIFVFAVLCAATTRAQVTGVKVIGVDYPNLAAAITDLNTSGVGAGGATINVPANYTETVPVGGLVLGSTTLNASLSAVNTLTFQKSGAGTNPLLTAFAGGTSTTVDGIWKFAGTDYVTVDGIDIRENPANSGAAFMEWGYALLNLNAAAPFDGVQNFTLKNSMITLDRSNPNGAFGVYSAHNTATSATALTLTAVGDLHSNNKFYTNTISNVNEGFWILGFAAPSPYTLFDQNNDVGGNSPATGNTLTMMGVTALFNTFCVYMVNQNNANASYNTIDNAAGGGVSSTTQLIGVYAGGTTASVTARNNNVTLTTAGGTAVVGGVYTANTGNSTITNNTVAFSDAAGSGTHYGIYVATAATFNATVTNNTLSANTTGPVTGTFYFIYNSAAAASNTITGNTISNVNTSTTGTTAGIYNASSPTSYTVSNNTISNFNRSAASGTHYGIYTGSPATGTFNANTIENISFTNLTSTGTIYGIYDISSGVTMNYTNNIIRNFSTPTTGTLYGIREFGVTGNKTIQNNQVYNFGTTPGGAGGASMTGISWLAGGPTDDISNNQIYSLNSTGTTGGTGGTIIGMLVSSGTINNIYKNKIYDLSTNSTGGSVYGLQITAGTTNNVYNNLIGDLEAPFVSSTTDLVRGINITATTTNANQNISFNTVWLNATSSGANFSTTGIYHTTSTTATTSTLNLRNNIIVNNSTAKGTGVTVAFRRSSTTLTNYGASSDRNLFYAGLPCGSNLIFYDGTNSDQTLTAYKARVAPRDANSITEDPNFLSTTGSSANFLHINPAIPTQIESAGVTIAGITDDFDGNVRSGTPDIGADEFTGVVATNCVGTPTPGTAAASPATICTGQSSMICLTGQSAGAGIALQWQSATSAGGPFTDISCAGSNCYNTGVLTAGTYYYRARVTCNGSGLSDVSNVVTLVVEANPTLAVTPNAPTICTGGSGVSLTASGATTYTWSPATGLSSTSGATVTANPATTTTYTVTGVNAAGCSSTTTVTVTVNQSPSISSITATPASLCAGGNSQLNAVASSNILGYDITTVPFAPISSGTGTVVLASGGTAVTPMTTTTLDDGYWNNLTLPFPFTYYGTSYTTFNVQTNGVMSFSPFTTTTGYGNSPQMPNTLAPNNMVGVFGDMDWRSGGIISYYTSGTAPNRIFVINFDGSTGGGFYNSGSTPTALVNYQIQLFENGNKIQIHTTSIATDASHNHTMGAEDALGTSAAVVPGRDNSLWTLSNNGTEFSIPTVTYAWAPSTYLNSTSIPNPLASGVLNTTNYTLTVSNANGCTSTGNVTVTVTTPTVTGVITQPTTCVSTNGAITLTVSGGSGGGYSYAWTGTGVNPTSQNQTNLGVGNYSVTVTDINSGCSRTVPFLVLGPGGCNICPTLPSLTSNPSPAVCPNTNITFTSSGMTDMGVTYGITFKYSPVSLADPYTGGTIISTVPNSGLTNGATQAATTTTFATPGTYFVYAILSPLPLDPSCRPVAQSTITVNPTPTVNTVASQTVCNGAATTAVNFTGAVAGTVYNWTNSNSTIGLPASGTGNIASFNAINTGTVPVTSTITVTPAYTNGGATCTGTPTTFTITVNPNPTVNAVSNQTLCNAASSSPVNFTGSVPGTVYNWTNSNPAIGLPASGTGNIAPFVATNSGTAPISGTITVTPTFTNNATTCTGTPVSFTITVNPTPTVNAISNQVVCAGSTTAAVTIGGPVAGAVYNWTNTNTATGLAASGTGNIAAFTATNTTTAPITSNITVIPVIGNCPGTPLTFTITVNPRPTATAVTSQTVCAGSSTTAVTFAGTVPNTVFNWTNNTTSIGLAASGTGNIPAFTAVNNGATAVVATITVTPSFTSGGTTCTGTPITFTYTVNPRPAVSATALSNRICISDSAIALVGTPVGGNWSGIGVSGFNFVPSSTAVGVYTLTYTYASTAGCTNTATITAKVEDCPERLRTLSQGALTIYPNPNNGRFNIRVNSTLYNYIGMKVFDMNGRLVNGKIINDVLTSTIFSGLTYGRVIPVDLSYLPAGTYVVKLYYDAGNLSSDIGVKIVIVH